MDRKKVLKVVANKYFLTGLAFVAWIAYFDQNDWMTLQQRQKELNGIKDNITYLSSEISRMETEKNALTLNPTGSLNDPQKLEQYAREHFRMKQTGEDIYVIEK